jgi:hypothetical protein
MTTLPAPIRDSHAMAQGQRVHYIASGRSDAPLLAHRDTVAERH